MLTEYILLICIFQASYALSPAAQSNLNDILASTTNFFNKMKLNYGSSRLLSSELFEKIDDEAGEYLKKIMSSTKSSRIKRQMDLLNKEAVGILNGFEGSPGLELTNTLDFSFFRQSGGIAAGEFGWYLAALNATGVSLLQFDGSSFNQVDFYPLRNGIRIISQGCETTTLFVVQRSIGDSTVLRLSGTNGIGKGRIREVQTLDTGGPLSHSAIWRGIKQNIYLAVANRRNLTIFTWLGEHFDRIQFENIGAEKVIPFQIDGSMHLIASDRLGSSVLKFLLRSNEFVLSQRLVGAKDATAFHLDKGHRTEHFVALAGERSTIIYKQSRHRFVPFQEIYLATDKIRSFVNDASAILLIFIRNGEARISQYDGWRFVESSVKVTGILDAIPLQAMLNHEFIALRFRNSGEESVASLWSFQRIIWRGRKSWTSLRDETNAWCWESLDKARINVSSSISDVLERGERRIVIKKGHFGTLRVRKINDRSAESFRNLTERWKRIASESIRLKEAMKNYISSVNPTFNNLRAKKVRVNCASNCRAEKTTSPTMETLIKRLRRSDDCYQNIDLEIARVRIAKNLPCPFPLPKFPDAEITGLTNGISFSELAKDALMTTGDQELIGAFKFAELRVNNAQIPVDVAFNFTKASIVTETTRGMLRVDDLEVRSGGPLLPLTPDSQNTVVTGSLTVSKATFKGLVHMIGKIDGRSKNSVSPSIEIPKSLDLIGNYSLANVRIVGKLEIEDLAGRSGKSLNQVISNAVPLDATNVPLHMKFREDKVSWKNVTVQNFPYKWVITKNSGGDSRPEHLIVTGRKRATGANLTLGESAFRNLPTPSLSIRLCSVTALSEGIWESNLLVDRATAKSVKTIRLFDESELGDVYTDSATCLDEIPWELVNFTGSIRVSKEARGIENAPIFGDSADSGVWIEPGRLLKGPLVVGNFQADRLITTAGFAIPLPLQVGNVESRGNLYVGTINGIEIQEFMSSVAKIETEEEENRSVYLKNVTFLDDIVAEDIFASQTSFSLDTDFASGYLGSKEILGTLESRTIVVPNVLHYLPLTDVPLKIIANGNVSFVGEPKIKNVNRKNLDELYGNVWLTDRSTNVSVEFIEFKDVTFESDARLADNRLYTPNLGSWSDIEDKLLSKTKQQTINVPATFNSFEAPNIIGSAKSHLRSDDPFLHDLEFNSLKKNDTLAIGSNWHFEELIVTGNLDLRGTINGLNLRTDVVRNDGKYITITGRKTIGGLTARNIDGLKFDEFARNALRSSNNGNETIVIKGRKTFGSVLMEDITVNGTIFGKRIENALLNDTTQNISGIKIFRGSLRAPEIIITNGTVNDINLKRFIEYHLKKRAPLQIIKTRILLANDLTILGNMTIGGLYSGVDLSNFKTARTALQPAITKMSELMNFAEGIEVAIQNRAIYWDKLELVQENASLLISQVAKTEAKAVEFDGLGSCKVEASALHCNNQRILDLAAINSNGSRLILGEIVTLSGISLIVSVTSDPNGGVAVYRFNFAAERFERAADLRLDGIVGNPVVATMMDTLWIILSLRDDTMILRYDLWAEDFAQWILSGGCDSLATGSSIYVSSSPTEELLLFRNDGVWKLGGLAGPRHVFPAILSGEITTFARDRDYYVQMTDKNVTTLLKSRFIGN